MSESEEKPANDMPDFLKSIIQLSVYNKAPYNGQELTSKEIWGKLEMLRYEHVNHVLAIGRFGQQTKEALTDHADNIRALIQRADHAWESFHQMYYAQQGEIEQLQTLVYSLRDKLDALERKNS